MGDRCYVRDLPFGTKATTNSRLRNLQIAQTLIAGGVRPINAHYCTRINKRYLTQLWVDTHGYPARGQTPLFSHVYMKAHKAVRKGIVFVMMLKLYGLSASNTGDAGDFLYVFERYRALPDTENLEMEVAFYLWRDYTNNTIQLKHCSSCKSGYLYTLAPDAPSTMRSCPFCRITRAYKNNHDRMVK